MGFIIGLSRHSSTSTIMLTSYRNRDNLPVRRWPQWCHADTGQVYAGLGCDFWVCFLHLQGWFEWLENHRLTEAFPYRLFMSIGSVIRSEGPVNDAWLRARGPPMMLPRQSPLRQ
jgi:hypothetical protein